MNERGAQKLGLSFHGFLKSSTGLFYLPSALFKGNGKKDKSNWK